MTEISNRLTAACAVALLFPPLLTAAPPPDVAQQAKTLDLLKVIQRVEPEGRGNVEAARAWRQLVQLDAGMLPVILANLNDDNPLAANWIRGAVDTIAERTLASGDKLPQAELEEFLKDTNQWPRARRVAFEWLLRIDPGADDRLIPKMLHDPSVEFRRDAVSRLIDAARQEDEAKDKAQAAAVALYKEALSAARDEDQVKRIVERLRGYGEEINVAEHFGFLMRWKLIGPFDNVEKRGFDTPYPPEENVELDAEYAGKSTTVRWVDYVSTDEYGQVSLNQGLVEEKGVAGYAYHEFTSDKDQEVELRVGTKNAWKLWVNGKLAYVRNEYHHGTRLDHYHAKARLKKGKNAILLKVCQNDLVVSWTKVWRFQIRVCDSVGTAILSATRHSADAAPDTPVNSSDDNASAKGGK